MKSLTQKQGCMLKCLEKKQYVYKLYFINFVDEDKLSIIIYRNLLKLKKKISIESLIKCQNNTTIFLLQVLKQCKCTIILNNAYT